MSYNVSLSKCGSCGHFDVEHEIKFGENYTPQGAGHCRICIDCDDFKDQPSVKALRKEEAKALVAERDVTQQAQWDMVTAMVSDDEFLKNVLRTVYVKRIEFLHKYSEAVMVEEPVNHAELVSTFKQIRETYLTVGRTRLDQNQQETWTRRASIALTFIAEAKAKLLSRRK
jgi:hypothetical protein